MATILINSKGEIERDVTVVLQHKTNQIPCRTMSEAFAAASAGDTIFVTPKHEEPAGRE